VGSVVGPCIFPFWSIKAFRTGQAVVVAAGPAAYRNADWSVISAEASYIFRDGGDFQLIRLGDCPAPGNRTAFRIGYGNFVGSVGEACDVFCYCIKAVRSGPAVSVAAGSAAYRNAD